MKRERKIRIGIVLLLAILSVTPPICSQPAKQFVTSATTNDTIGQAYKIVIKDLVEKQKLIDKAESRERLKPEDRAILKSSDPTAVFNPRLILPSEIKNATKTLDLKVDQQTEITR